MAKEKEEIVWPEPPEFLSEESKELFRFYVGLTVRAPAQIELFVTGLRARDQAVEAAEILKQEGLTIESKRSGMKRQHPCLNIQKESLAMFLKVWKTLGLQRNSYQPPGAFSWEDIV